MTNFTKERNYCFTWNGEEADVVAKYEFMKKLNIDELKIKYCCFALERGDVSERLHVQGYIEFKHAIKKITVQKRLDGGFWLSDKRLGTRRQARGYVMDPNYPGKTGTTVEGSRTDLGLWILQGQSADLVELYEMIKQGATDYDLQEANPGCYARHWKALEKFRYNFDQATTPIYKEIEVHVLYGDSRSGKTRSVYEKHGDENVCKLKCVGDRLWFSNYQGQDVLLIDEFYGQIKFTEMLSILDNYRQDVEIKGGHKIAKWTKVYLTSNCHPKKWYNNWAKIPRGPAIAFMKRITTITKKVNVEVQKLDNIFDALPEEVVMDQDNKIIEKKEPLEQRFLGNNELEPPSIQMTQKEFNKYIDECKSGKKNVYDIYNPSQIINFDHMVKIWEKEHRKTANERYDSSDDSSDVF